MVRLLAIVLILVIAACSRLQLAYKLADEYIVRQANNFFDLTEEQYKETKNRVEKDLERIKDTRAPQAAQFLRRIITHVKTNNVDLELVGRLFEEGQKLANKSVLEFENTAVDLSNQLNADQIKNFVGEFNNKLDEYKEKVDSPRAQDKFQRKKTLKWLNEWVGMIEVEQERALEKFVENNPFPYELQIKHREMMRDKFLEARKDAKKLRIYLRTLLTAQDPEYKAAMKTYNDSLKTYIVETYKTLSKKQKEYLIERLESRIQQLEELIHN